MIAQAACGRARGQVGDDGSLEIDGGSRPEAPLTERRHRRERLRRACGRSSRQSPIARTRSSSSSPARSPSASPCTPPASRPTGPSPSRAPPSGAGAALLVAAAPRPLPLAPLVVFVDEPGLAAAMRPRLPARRRPPSTSCRARWPPSSTTPSPGCTAAARRRLAPRPRRPARRSCRCRSTAASIDHAGALGAVPRAGRLGGVGCRADQPARSAPTPERLWRPLSVDVVRARPGRLRPDPAARAGARHARPAASAGHDPSQAEPILSLTGRAGRAASTTQTLRRAPHRRRLTAGAVTAGDVICVVGERRRSPRRSARAGHGAAQRDRSSTTSATTQLDDPIVSDADYDDLVARAAGARGASTPTLDHARLADPAGGRRRPRPPSPRSCTACR